MKDQPRAVIYARFSTENQKDASIDDQVRGCERLARNAGLNIVRIYADRGISAGTSQRPEYQALVGAARAQEFEIILAEDISRLWRNRAEYGVRSAEFEDLGVHLMTCVGDDTRRDGWGLVLGMKHAIAEHQRREISYRTRRGLEGCALVGASTGGRCYGYCGAQVNTFEAVIVRRIFNQAIQHPARIVAMNLNIDEVASPRGGLWNPSTVQSILTNSRYTGRLCWGATENRGRAADSARKIRTRRPEPLVERVDEGQRIVSDELWQAAQDAAKNRLHVSREYGLLPPG